LLTPHLCLPTAVPAALKSGPALILADGLSHDLAPLLAGAQLALVTLPPEPDPLAAITDQLQQARCNGAPVSTVHLVAHGRSGAVRLGNRWITTASLVAAATDLALWNVERIALWSCHTGADPDFTATLAELTGAQVLSSPELIGSLAGQTISSPAGETLQLQALFTAPAIAAWAGSLANEYTLANQQLDFTFAPDNPNRTVLLAGGYDASTARLLPGTQYLYKNVVTIDGKVIDAIVCINAYQKAYVTRPENFDNNQLQYSADLPTTDPSYDSLAPSYFQPNIQILPTGRNTTDLEQYVDFTVSFVETNPTTGSRDLVILKNLVIDIFDVDGNGASQTARQFVEIDDVGNYVLADNTNLVVSTGIGGEGIRFSAPPNDGTNYIDKPETPIGDTVRAQVRYPGGVSSFKFQLGDYAFNNRLGGYNALFALDFGAGRDFSVLTDEFGLKAETVCVAECGNQALITVCLVGPKDANGNPTRPPTADVTVDLYDFFNRSAAFGSLPNVVTNPDGSLTVNNEFTLSTSRLVFTTANWTQAQTITVTGLDDNVIDGNFIFNALLRASSTDQYYNRLSTGIDIKNLDNDTLITAPTVASDAGFAVFDLTAAAGRILLFSAVDGTTSGIGNASIETSSDGGTTWTAYNGASGFKVPGAGAVAFKARVSLAPLPVFDGSKTFKLVVGSPDVPCPTEATATVVGLASIGDHVWVDANGNGQQDAGEIGLAGVGVELFASVAGLPSGAAVATTTTDANGGYLFNNLAGGTYILRFITPSGYLFTAANIGADTTDSDAGPGGYSGTYTVDRGTREETIDAGMYLSASIAGTVYADTNNNGTQETGELGIGGVTITLSGTDDLSNTVTQTTTTAANGTYSFVGLRRGTYTVSETQATGHLDGKDSAGNSGGTLTNDQVSNIILTAGSSATGINFGELLPASLRGTVFADTNNDGIQNNGEVGIGGVAITLTGTNDLGTIAPLSITTAADGTYSFSGLRPGTYTVSETQPGTFDDGIDSVGSSGGTLGPDQVSNINLTSGTNATGYNFGERPTGGSLPGGDLQITKSDGLTKVVAGQCITYTIDVKNAGSSAVSNAVVTDLMPANLGNVTWTSAVVAGTALGNDASGIGNINDTITSLGANSIVRYTVNATVAKPGTYTSTTVSNFNFNAAVNGATNGITANTRTFTSTSGNVTLTASAFSREQVGYNPVSWSSAYLGQYTTGLGITNGSEKGSNEYRLDNVGNRKDYLLIQFSESVVLNKAYLKGVLSDSDASFWIGNAETLTSLNDATLANLVYEKSGGGKSDRTADVNDRNLVANTLVIAADDKESKGDDNFTISGLDVYKQTTISSTITNTATVTGPNGFVDAIPTNNSATDVDTIISAPGCRTADFWVKKSWQSFWDGKESNEPGESGTTNYAKGDLFLAPYTSSKEGKVLDPVTGTYQGGVLIGDWNRNGCTDKGEETIFYNTSEALKVMDSSLQPDRSDARYTLASSLVASWLNHVAGNSVDTAATNDIDARVCINGGITWLQTYTPDENKDGKGDGMLSQLSSYASPSIKTSSPFWTVANTIGSAISSGLDKYNNGNSLLADGCFFGGL